MKDPTAKLKFKEKIISQNVKNRAQIKNNRLFKENNFELMIEKRSFIMESYIF